MNWWRRKLSRREWYRGTYLESEHWVAFRSGWWARHQGARCARRGLFHRCGGSLDLHHLTYARVGHELDGDVEPLCRSRHDRAHRVSRRRTRRHGRRGAGHARVSVWNG